LLNERDACGIGFVADASGRSSRAVVEAALQGLACMTHRGAVAADAKSADGSGLLLPIPATVFGEGRGVVSMFVRGDDPREAVEKAAAGGHHRRRVAHAAHRRQRAGRAGHELAPDLPAGRHRVELAQPP
jgi:glutamate synthase domain-containing protein 1